jgi:hypothetical protein
MFPVNHQPAAAQTARAAMWHGGWPRKPGGSSHAARSHARAGFGSPSSSQRAPCCPVPTGFHPSPGGQPPLVALGPVSSWLRGKTLQRGLLAAQSTTPAPAMSQGPAVRETLGCKASAQPRRWRLPPNQDLCRERPKPFDSTTQDVRTPSGVRHRRPWSCDVAPGAATSPLELRRRPWSCEVAPRDHAAVRPRSGRTAVVKTALG